MQTTQTHDVQEAVLVYGNHGDAPAVLEDFLFLLEEAFLDSGIQLKYSPTIVPNKLNIFVEYFAKVDCVDEMVRTKAQYPATEYVCLATEIVTGSTFNNFHNESARANKVWNTKGAIQFLKKSVLSLRSFLKKAFPYFYYSAAKVVIGRYGQAYKNITETSSHYSSRPYWDDRYKCFAQLVPYFKSIWCVSEFQLEGYRNEFKNSKIEYIPLVTFRTEVKLVQPEDSKKDIDFMFTGTLTKYRQQLIDRLKEKGYSVFTSSANLPTYLREHFIKRTKVCLDIRQSKEWKASSPMRLHYLMLHGAVVVAEAGSMACHEESYVMTVDSDQFIATCEQQVQLGQFAKRGSEQFRKYSASLEPFRAQARKLIREVMSVDSSVSAKTNSKSAEQTSVQL